MNKPYNIQNTNICNGIYHISFFKALLINEGETTWGERESGRNDPGRTGIGAKRLTGRTGFGTKRSGFSWQSVLTTTNVVSSIPAQTSCPRYNIM